MTTTTGLKTVSLGHHSSARHHHQRDYSPVSWIEYFDEAHDVVIDRNHRDQLSLSLSHNQSSLPTDYPQQATAAATATAPAEETTAASVVTSSVEAITSTVTATATATAIATTTREEQTCAAQDSFRVYLKNFHEPYAPARKPGEQLDPSKVELSEAQLTEYSKVPTLVALHGGGYSGLTWAQFTKHIQQQCKCRVLAMDLRGHGDTKTSHDDQMDIDTLVSDVIAVVDATHEICGFPQTPKIVLIGHSMGGAIAVKCSTKSLEPSLPSLAGFVIIDVVEGTAKDALPLMMSVIKTRPTKFPSLANAIEWSVRSGMAKNSDAARVSMPGNLVSLAASHLSIHDVQPKEDDELKLSLLNKIKRHKFSISIDQLIGQSLPAALLPRLACPLPARVGELRGGLSSLSHGASPMSMAERLPETITTNATIINEEPEEPTEGTMAEVVNASAVGGSSELSCDSGNLASPSTRPPKRPSEDRADDSNGYKRPPEVDSSGYGWRTNLARTQPYWNGWFDGLSAQLLDSPVQGKFLLLAGIDRLDKALTIGHMQGKFMMKVLPKCGHAVHEDVPEQVALSIGDFLVRNKFTVASDT